MKVLSTSLDGVLLIEPAIFGDPRGCFLETYQLKRYTESGIDVKFVQDNLSYSIKDTLRGLHFQLPHTQAKLVYVLEGEVFDVAVDIRVGSPTFGKWFGTVLSSENKRQLFIPEGFAHGFAVMGDRAVFAYKCSDYYHPACERGIYWNDPSIHIEWPLTTPLLSEKDSSYPNLNDAPVDFLPRYEVNR